MLYYLNELYHIAIYAADQREADNLNTLFQSSGKIIDIPNSSELYTNIFDYMHFSSTKVLHAYKLFNNTGATMFIYLSHDAGNCRIIKDYFKMGDVIEIKTDLNKLKKSSLPFSGPTALKKKLDVIKPDIVRNCSLGDPKASKEVPAPITITEEPAELVNYDTSYDTDAVFADAIRGAQLLKNNYDKALKQKQELIKLVDTCDKETLDILHELELEFKWYDIPTAYKTALKIAKVRKQRRRAKDKLEVINTLEESLSLECLNKISEIPDRLTNRIYSKRNNTGMFDFEGKILDKLKNKGN